jgi:hypothetical protein
MVFILTRFLNAICVGVKEGNCRLFNLVECKKTIKSPFYQKIDAFS